MSTSAHLRRRLAQSGLIRALAPHDVFTARVLDAAGVELLFLGGFGVSASMCGLPDLGLATLTEMVEATRRIAQRVATPVIADADTGHGDLHNVAWTVRQFESAGAAGVLLEDQVAPKRCGHFAGKQVIAAEAMVAKLRTARLACRDPDFVIIARTDALAVEGLEPALARARLYAAAGADLGFVEAPRSVEELTRIARESPLPQLANMLPGGATPLLDADALERLGFKIVVDPLATLMLTARAVRDLGWAWRRDGSVAALRDRMADFEEVKRIVGLDEFLSWGDGQPPWAEPVWVERAQAMLDSYARWRGEELIPRSGDPLAQSRALFEAPFVVVAHGTEADPILNYANRRAVTLWETDLATLLRTPSRLTAEPVHREERAELLERTRRDGFVDDYRGVRISLRGNRFRIERATVWNVVGPSGEPAGQAATFRDWLPLPGGTPATPEQTG
jgi:2-methylisocitrate lyase-like PEP mutase family enzyme